MAKPTSLYYGALTETDRANRERAVLKLIKAKTPSGQNNIECMMQQECSSDGPEMPFALICSPGNGTYMAIPTIETQPQYSQAILDLESGKNSAAEPLLKFFLELHRIDPLDAMGYTAATILNYVLQNPDADTSFLAKIIKGIFNSGATITTESLKAAGIQSGELAFITGIYHTHYGQHSIAPSDADHRGATAIPAFVGAYAHLSNITTVYSIFDGKEKEIGIIQHTEELEIFAAKRSERPILHAEYAGPYHCQLTIKDTEGLHALVTMAVDEPLPRAIHLSGNKQVLTFPYSGRDATIAAINILGNMSAISLRYELESRITQGTQQTLKTA